MLLSERDLLLLCWIGNNKWESYSSLNVENLRNEKLTMHRLDILGSFISDVSAVKNHILSMADAIDKEISAGKTIQSMIPEKELNKLKADVRLRARLLNRPVDEILDYFENPSGVLFHMQYFIYTHVFTRAEMRQILVDDYIGISPAAAKMYGNMFPDAFIHDLQFRDFSVNTDHCDSIFF